MSANKNNHQILEPITSIGRLITLSFKSIGTKIAFRSHNVVLCDSNAFYHGADRYMYGASRNDMYVLNHVIYNFINLYVLPYKNEDYEIYRGLINLTKYLCVSLKRLQHVYKSGNVVLTLQYIIIVLHAIIDDTFYPEILYNLDRKS